MECSYVHLLVSDKSTLSCVLQVQRSTYTKWGKKKEHHLTLKKSKTNDGLPYSCCYGRIVRFLFTRAVLDEIYSLAVNAGIRIAMRKIGIKTYN